jgi:hypothetical protein
MARPLTEEIFTETIMPIWRGDTRRGFNPNPDIQRILTSRNSVPIDKYSIYGNLSETTRIHKYFRLAYKLGLGLGGMTTHMARFAVDFDKFRTRRNARNYNISGRPFSTMSISEQDPKVAKVKTFLRRHLTREPTDKDVDLVVYTYFGSDAFGAFPTTDDLYNGLQDSYYNARGRKIHSGASGAPRRRQSRIRSYRNMYNSSTYRYHDYNSYNSTNNTNILTSNNGLGSNSNNNGLGSNSNNNGLGSNSNSNSRPTAVEYLQNKPAVKRNQNRNKSNNAKKIQWTENTVSNMPRDRISFENFSNGQKAVKYTWREGEGIFTQYIEPNTFRTQARMSMTDAYNKPYYGSFSMFKNPFTRNGRDVKRSNINFVILKKRVNKRKTNAATKIQKVVRGRHKRKTNAATKIQKVVRGTQVRNKIRKNAQNALNKLAVVQKSVLKKKTEKQATAKRKRNAEDEAKRKRGRSITRRMKNAVVNTARRVKRKITR